MPPVSPALEIKIDLIPPNGEWWNRNTRETFIKAAGVMLNAGISEAEIVSLLAEMFSAVRAEYGD